MKNIPVLIFLLVSLLAAIVITVVVYQGGRLLGLA